MIQDPHSVIHTIRLSEKATRLGEENNEYVFIVDKKANKLQIKAAVVLFERGQRGIDRAIGQNCFDPEHLRRVLVNLLDNALRHATGSSGSIQVSTRTSATGRVMLGVWSDGPPLEMSVERHLFEPFFSSESRSSGLGLYICRELCEGHGASMAYQRSSRTMAGVAQQGNEFLVVMLPLRPGQQPGLF